MTRRDRFITQALVAAIFIVALLVVGHSAHAYSGPDPHATATAARAKFAADQEFLAQLTCGLLTLIIWL